METYNLLLILVGVAFGVFIIGFLMRLLKQPHVISYILAGIIIGPFGLNLISNPNVLNSIGEFGVILLMFFIGMEICVPCIVSKWRITIFGTLLQVLLSIVLIAIAGAFFKWDLPFIIMLGFIISLSSTSVVIKILENKKEINTNIGQNVLGILIIQDIIVVPMIVILNILGGKSPEISSILLNIFGGVIFLAILIYVLKKGEFNLPLHSLIKKDYDLQIFAAFLICFGMAALSQIFGLSAALGAFIGGFLVKSSKDTKWVSKSLHSFYIVFIALFFLYIGMLMDISLLLSNSIIITTLVFVVFAINTLINLLVFRILGRNLKESLYAGALLSQIGEFSFIIGAVGFSNNIITYYEYSLIVLTISLTLFLSPFWIWLIRKWTKVKCEGEICIFK